MSYTIVLKRIKNAQSIVELAKIIQEKNYIYGEAGVLIYNKE
jgi:hypothetical protein